MNLYEILKQTLFDGELLRDSKNSDHEVISLLIQNMITHGSPEILYYLKNALNITRLPEKCIKCGNILKWDR
jgi:hypothetical protein